MPVTPKLELQNITRIFDGVTVVDDLTISLMPGQVTCLLGPSGCGKSTTLRIAAGVDQQNSGQVLLDGVIISDDSVHLPPERRSIGLMFQDFALFPHLSVVDNVAFGLKSKGKREVALGLLDKVGLKHTAERFPHQLSGGEQQRVALARALAPNPAVMLMDEPFSGLDNRLRDGIRDDTLAILKEMNTAVLLVTHEPEEAMRMADNIALMRAGKVVQYGAPYNLYNAPVDRKVAGFFSDINVIHGVVQNMQAETPFGQFFTPNLVDGADVEIIVRPQHLKIDFDRQGKGPLPTPQDGVPARGVIKRARFMGNESLVELEMDYDKSVLSATIPGVFLPSEGTPLWLSLRRDRCFVFPCENQSIVKSPYMEKNSAD
ncbi:MAG: ABC transporter ATP-binding protein [Rhodobacteraceae bacterium]|nr:ABC transporter ATP-binding protein [Paracoccaceae bacterium]